MLLGKPLVSASALRADGQLIVLNSPPGRGPCYRCIWPRPPPAESVASCGEAGVLGPVVGVMGVLQALEAIRLIASPLSPDHDAKESRMLFFSAYAPTPWRTLRMRGKRPLCVACGAPEDLRDKISAAALTEGVFDYVGFCGSGGEGRVQLAEEHRMTVPEVKSEVVPPLVVDVRDRTQFGICSVPGSVNVPFSEFQSTAGLVDGNGCSVLPEDMARLLRNMEKERAVVVVCRLGNDSQEAARQVMESGVFKGRVYDVRGGIREWAKVAPQDGVVEY